MGKEDSNNISRGEFLKFATLYAASYVVAKATKESEVVTKVTNIIEYPSAYCQNGPFPETAECHLVSNKVVSQSPDVCTQLAPEVSEEDCLNTLNAHGNNPSNITSLIVPSNDSETVTFGPTSISREKLVVAMEEAAKPLPKDEPLTLKEKINLTANIGKYGIPIFESLRVMQTLFSKFAKKVNQLAES